MYNASIAPFQRPRKVSDFLDGSATGHEEGYDSNYLKRDFRSTEEELVNILTDRDRSGARGTSNDQLSEATKRRLKLWNVSDQEIADLEKNRKPSDQLMLRSPFDGVVNEVMSRPGMSVKMGDKLVSGLDLSNLLVWAEFYENEVALLKQGRRIDSALPHLPNQTFQGQIAVINPLLDA